MSPEKINIQESLTKILSGERDQEIVEEVNSFKYPFTSDVETQIAAVETATGYTREEPEYPIVRELLKASKVVAFRKQLSVEAQLTDFSINWIRALASFKLLADCEVDDRALYFDQIFQYVYQSSENAEFDDIPHVIAITNAIIGYEEKEA